MERDVPEYGITRLIRDGDLVRDARLWKDVPALHISNYLWLHNNYEPRAEVRLCYSAAYLYVYFRVEERQIRVRFSKFQDPVYKDSCVEFFIDPFPGKPMGYINIETNALGTMLIAIGRDRERRTPLRPSDLKGFECEASVKRPTDGFHGADFWTLRYRLPFSLFKRYYGDEISPGHRARGNFYKCGDETKYPHYGAWSPVMTPSPDFHRPEFFGKIIFK